MPAATPASAPAASSAAVSRLAVGMPSSRLPRPKPLTTTPRSSSGVASGCISPARALAPAPHAAHGPRESRGRRRARRLRWRTATADSACVALRARTDAAANGATDAALQVTIAQLIKLERVQPKNAARRDECARGMGARARTATVPGGVSLQMNRKNHTRGLLKSLNVR